MDKRVLFLLVSSIYIGILVTTFDRVFASPEGNAFEVWGDMPSFPLVSPVPEGWTEDIVVGEVAKVIFTEEDKRRGFVVFTRHYQQLVYPYTVPKSDEITDRLRIFASPGEYEPVTFSIYALKNINSVSVKVTDFVDKEGNLIPARCVDVRVGLYVNALIDFSRKLYRVQPALLTKENHLTIPENRTQQFWLNIWIPKDTKEGIYEGKVVIESKGAELTHLTLTIKVLPIDLQKTDIAHGVWYGPVWGWKHTYEKNIPKHFLDMRECGINSVLMWNIPPSISINNEGKIEVTPDHIEQVVNAFMEAGLDGPVVVDCRVVNGWCSNYGKARRNAEKENRNLSSSDIIEGYYRIPVFDDEYSREAFKSVISQIQSHAKEEKWPPIYFYIEEEATNMAVRLEQLYYYTPLIHEVLGAKAILISNGPKTAGLDEAVKIGPYLDVRTYNSVDETFLRRTKEEGDEFWIYNHLRVESPRLDYGFYAVKIGALGVSIWTYQCGNPRGHDCPPGIFSSEGYLSYPSPNGPIPMLDWICIREGIDDSRYVSTLRSLIKEADKVEKPEIVQAAREAQNQLDNLLSNIPLNTPEVRKFAVETSPKTYDIYRWQVAKEILKLQALLKKNKQE